jgi:N6-adenosine-specific RNA methylase IME4
VNTLTLPAMKAGAILADPPIPFEAWSRKGEGPRSPQAHYSCLAFEELAAIPVASVAAPNCFLFLWMPSRSMPLVLPLMNAWGFTFSGKAFAWAKQNRNGSWFMGTGYGTRKNSEDCWLGRRGKPRRKDSKEARKVSELIIARRREHSRKPDGVYERIEAFCDGPYLELFARQQWPNWICVGDELGKFQLEI